MLLRISFRMGDVTHVRSLLTCLCLLVNTMWRVEAIQVIGGRRTVVEGQDVDLPCKLLDMDNKDELTQITWQRKTKENQENHNFYIISPKDGPKPVNGGGSDRSRLQFIGSVAENNGSMQLRRARLLDEGTYTCIFTVFPGGRHETEIPLTVLVPPIMSVAVDAPPVVGHEEVTLATCMAANAKPAAEITWVTEALGLRGRWVTNSTQHGNGTTTVISHLLGVPTRDANQQLVQCVVTQSALETERTLSYSLNIVYPPLSVNVSSHVGRFHCIADGNPTPLYTWNRVGQPWPAAAVRQGDSLTFSPTSDLNGLYVCEASNVYGTSTASLYVHTSDSSCTCCIVLGIFLCLCLIAAAAGVVWYWKKHDTLPCLDMASKGESTAARRQRREEEEEEEEEVVVVREESVPLREPSGERIEAS